MQRKESFLCIKVTSLEFFKGGFLHFNEIISMVQREHAESSPRNQSRADVSRCDAFSSSHLKIFLFSICLVFCPNFLLSLLEMAKHFVIKFVDKLLVSGNATHFVRTQKDGQD